MVLSSSDAGQSFVLAVIISTLAVIWNFLFNTGFESLEAKLKITHRTFKVRSSHTLGFELGLFLMCLPLYMFWYDVGVLKAMYMETTLLLFFLIYTYLFTWAFDQIFTLPQNLPPTPKPWFQLTFYLCSSG